MDEAGLRRELEQHHEDAYGWALHCCRRNPEDAQDVLQTTYLKALSGKARFDGRSSVRTWLFAVIRNTAADHYRSIERPLAVARPQPVEIGPAAELLDALARLSERQREVLHLAFYQGMTLEEAAGVLEISVGTARTHYERGKARLRELLAKEKV
ncbi:MAG: RNA polymerase sigma factor [bacterium]|nr:RNA polymerase sigma factor [bacterium]